MKIHQYRTSRLTIQSQNQTFGHHGDIKPENVLWFGDPDHAKTKRGTLKLSDFGLAGFSMRNTMSERPRSMIATSLPYRAPERDIKGITAIGRSYDMWTLGCLYLEFVTWLLGGWNLVDVFASRRRQSDPWMYRKDTSTFFGLIQDETGNFKAEVKPAVTTVSFRFPNRQVKTLLTSGASS
jgi:serine/threonine protein kinase